jgi:hypothetical protein
MNNLTEKSIQIASCTLIGVQDVCDIILEFFSYEEAMSIYILLETREPKRPILKLREIYKIVSNSEEKNFPYLTQPHIINWYIPFIKGDEETLSSMMINYLIINLSSHNQLHWQCPDCLVYKKLEYKLESKSNKYKILSSVLCLKTGEAYYLCSCSAKALIKQEEQNINSVKCTLTNKYIDGDDYPAKNNYRTKMKRSWLDTHLLSKMVIINQRGKYHDFVPN